MAEKLANDANEKKKFISTTVSGGHWNELDLEPIEDSDLIGIYSMPAEVVGEGIHSQRDFLLRKDKAVMLRISWYSNQGGQLVNESGLRPAKFMGFDGQLIRRGEAQYDFNFMAIIPPQKLKQQI